MTLHEIRDFFATLQKIKNVAAQCPDIAEEAQPPQMLPPLTHSPPPAIVCRCYNTAAAGGGWRGWAPTTSLSRRLMANNKRGQHWQSTLTQTHNNQ
jgi:hypothetical protein